MTIDESISILSNTAWLGTDEDRERTEEAVKVAITALQKDGDAISRQDALDACRIRLDIFGFGDLIQKRIKRLPSVPVTITTLDDSLKLQNCNDKEQVSISRGWICPRCGRVLAIHVKTCPCSDKWKVTSNV